MTSTPNPMYAGLVGDDLARAKASDANLAGIVAGRRRAAQALMAPKAPLALLRARWAPVLHPEKATVVLWKADGPPLPNWRDTFPLAYPGDHYQDALTGDLYVLEAG